MRNCFFFISAQAFSNSWNTTMFILAAFWVPLYREFHFYFAHRFIHIKVSIINNFNFNFNCIHTKVSIIINFNSNFNGIRQGNSPQYQNTYLDLVV